jgi:DNA transformation protein
MFGGYGIYKDGIITAIIVDNELYFKVNEINIDDYKKHGCIPFTHIPHQGINFGDLL